MHPTLARLLSDGPVLTDGAWGTQLQQRGLQMGEFPDLWNLTHPESVLQVARSYVDAGSRVILTNTFGANRLRLAESGQQERVRDLNREGVRISRAAASGRALVFASLGPSGRLLCNGDVTPEDLAAAFREQAMAMAEGGADGIVVETMSDLDEATLAVAAARETGLPVVACMVFDSGKEKDRTMMGTTPEQVAEGLARAGAEVIGANCGQGVEGFVPICRRLRASTSLPLWIKANAGLPELENGRAVYRTTPGQFARWTGPLLGAGASFLGGCCGTAPEFIAAVHYEISQRRSAP
jgi:methionine synthase I (cobalamin-dependent)